MVLLQRKLYFTKDPGVQHFPGMCVCVCVGGGGPSNFFQGGGSKCLYLYTSIPLWIHTW